VNTNATATRTHYETLGVLITASEREVTLAYRALIRAHHPDRVGPDGEAMTVHLNRSYGVLRSAAKRAAYDLTLHVPERTAAPAPRKAKPAPGARPAKAAPEVAKVPAFPIGSEPRLALLALAFLPIISGLLFTAQSADVTSFVWVGLSVIGGLLLCVRKQVMLASLILTPTVLVGAADMYFGVLHAADTGLGLLAADAGWVIAALVCASMRKLRRHHLDAREWKVVLNAAAASRTRPYWVRLVEGRHVLLEEFGTRAQRTVHAWTDVLPSTWVALDSTGSIVATSRAAGPLAAKWVRADAAKRAGRR
jgi:hypothetical protein